MAPSWSSHASWYDSQHYAYWGNSGRSGSSVSGPSGSANHERYGHATSKIPPYWEPSFETRGYPYATWEQDINHWLAGTELPEERRAPAVVQRLGGAARALVREVPTNELRDGRIDPATATIKSGLTLLTRGLARRFGTFAVKAATRCIVALLRFHRGPGEDVDEAMLRF